MWERLRLAHTTLAAVRQKSVEESLAAAAGAGGGAGAPDAPDTVALRQAVNSSLSSQMSFFTSCMAAYCADQTAGCNCGCPGCGCVGRSSRQQALRAAALGPPRRPLPPQPVL
ncbi:hypothetical protein GPECTOR_82g237 [Gonium pectorale]|uniref:Uncharacterized protein n=1 Tax=Gonium pectorale TaxID=33097 RepID=A0A150G1G2_GONPE|nr:hypothetical protein GPECTOR_82g237 [Gonium pectorale]|eukprot:KXZ43703.1 hypothetical protein GPECTOR_82g237 [Gonium pectorale]